jgi:small-conductance mechanosensitive channel
MLQGPFRDENPDLFISLDAPEELQDKFYKGKIKIADLDEHPEYLDYLSNAHLDACVERPNLYFEGRDRDVYTVLEEISSREEVFDFIRENKKTMKYVNKRCNYLRITGESTLDEIRASMERRVESEIKARVIRYSEDAPDFFKEKYPEIVEGPTYLGVSELSDSCIKLLIICKCAEPDVWSVGRILNRELLLIFNRYGINIPYPHMTVVPKEENKD